MIVAELEVFHSRPVAPTRRVALGTVQLPIDPLPGHGATLLAGVAATFAPRLEPDLFDDYLRLLRDVEHDRRIAQPRLRHRFQHDRIGLTRSTHILFADAGRLRFRIEGGTGTPEQFLLAVAYACATLPLPARAAALASIHVGLAWRGSLDGRFVARVLGRGTDAALPALALADPVGWACRILGIPRTSTATRTLIQEHFRAALRDAHPDHGGQSDRAAERISDLAEARRILLS